MTQEDAFTSAVAYNMKGTVSGNYTYTENDFNIMFYDAQNEIVAYVELIAPSATTLQGVYHLNDGYVNNMAIAKVYDQGNAYEMTGGDLIFICKGTQKQTVQGYGEVTYYIYDVQGLNWHNKSTGVNVMEFHGTVAMSFQSWKTKELYTMTETAISATEIVLDDVVVLDVAPVDHDGVFFRRIGIDIVLSDKLCDLLADTAEGCGLFHAGKRAEKLIGVHKGNGDQRHFAFHIHSRLVEFNELLVFVDIQVRIDFQTGVFKDDRHQREHDRFCEKLYL